MRRRAGRENEEKEQDQQDEDGNDSQRLSFHIDLRVNGSGNSILFQNR
jgi:hypothetical protein